MNPQKYWWWVRPIELSRNQTGDSIQNRVLPMQVRNEDTQDISANNLLTTQNQNNEVVRVISL